MKKERGAILIVALLIISILMMAGAVVIKMTASGNRIVRMQLDRKKAYYLAEAGIETAKVRIIHYPDWFTDLPHDPNDDIKWLIDTADGHEEELGDGGFKIVRESGKNIIYSIGYIGKHGRKKAVSILYMEYRTDPFKQIKWGIL